MILEQLKALSDETRMRIVNVLREYELTVNEIVSVLNMGQSRISRHLKILSDAGLIDSRRDGLYVHYFYPSGQDGVIEHLSKELDEAREPDDRDRCRVVLAERREKTRLFFNSIAGSWKDLKEEILGDFDVNGKIADSLHHFGLHRVADLGCGNGDLAELLCRNGTDVIGIDYSPAMIEHARSRFSGLANAPDLRVGDIEHLPMCDSEVEGAVLSMVLHHLPDPRKSIAEIFRVVKQNGCFMLVDFDRHTDNSLCTRFGDRWPGFYRNELEQWIGEAGFLIENYELCEAQKGLKVHFYITKKQ
ncbi:MAG: metalloregulator ArsR/SmtB family transcription factor [Spirochaetes bacterium]|jgi:ubiquinone/menaquinone biosynthesis C-methylase UbiE/DNA-binding transcriptional ArsR family regulator|nr:metalloregulator ArsR/SmtB family transcription factor [Spirochaetota bacterium]